VGDAHGGHVAVQPLRRVDGIVSCRSEIPENTIATAMARRWRRPVAVVLVAYLVAVFPANVYVAVAGVPLDGLGGGNPWLRLPFQAVYIAWVFWAAPDLLGPLRTLLGQQRPTAPRR
jgi:uncharacterized membrane protein